MRPSYWLRRWQHTAIHLQATPSGIFQHEFQPDVICCQERQKNLWRDIPSTYRPFISNKNHHFTEFQKFRQRLMGLQELFVAVDDKKSDTPAWCLSGIYTTIRSTTAWEDTASRYDEAQIMPPETLHTPQQNSTEGFKYGPKLNPEGLTCVSPSNSQREKLQPGLGAGRGRLWWTS